MNLQPASTPTSGNDERPDEGRTRLHGPWLLLARIVWIAVVALILALFVASIPAFLAILHHGCAIAVCHALIPPSSVKQLQEAGFPLNFYLTYFYAMLALFILAFLTIGAVIFWLKSYDFLALYTSLALVTFAMGFNSSAL